MKTLRELSVMNTDGESMNTAGEAPHIERGKQQAVDLLLSVEQLGVTESDILKIEVQKAGLFKLILRIETKKGRWYFKQYVDRAPTAVFESIPETPALERAELAYQVQKKAVAATSLLGNVVPNIVAYEPEIQGFLMDFVDEPKPLIEYLSKGEVPNSAIRQLPSALALLHENTFGKYRPSSLFGNRTFRDFKLDLQYEQIAQKISSQGDELRRFLARYKNRSDCILHGDINSRNVLLNNHERVFIVDFEQSHLGAPAFDVAYILSEYLISFEYFGRTSERLLIIHQFLEKYFSVFDKDDRHHVECEITMHLGSQMLYRLWGPSKDQWTFYLDEQSKNRVIELGITLINSDYRPISDILPHLER
ncbi:MAG TPA: aminoglycoside phosphotransferase family protein [Candidatus Baltobacteraceae bacterium]|jgi:thiamine kinase-like enzyme|nr:aminoglycoside phosphotransferase family protein [Candidatus Baltobacteraceae bacterium]